VRVSGRVRGRGRGRGRGAGGEGEGGRDGMVRVREPNETATTKTEQRVHRKAFMPRIRVAGWRKGGDETTKS
jgi:hypothetical protein